MDDARLLPFRPAMLSIRHDACMMVGIPLPDVFSTFSQRYGQRPVVLQQQKRSNLATTAHGVLGEAIQAPTDPRVRDNRAGAPETATRRAGRRPSALRRPCYCPPVSTDMADDQAPLNNGVLMEKHERPVWTGDGEALSSAPRHPMPSGGEGTQTPRRWILVHCRRQCRVREKA